MIKKCPKCNERPAIKHPLYGYIECNLCQQNPNKPKQGIEFTTDQIRQQRREYYKDIIQPYRDGVLSKEYIEAYGRSGIKVSKREAKKAKYVWKDTKGWWNRDK